MKIIISLLILLLVLASISLPARSTVGQERKPLEGQEERDVALLGLNIGLSSFNLYNISERGSVVWGLVGFGVGVASLALATSEDPGTQHQRSLQIVGCAGFAIGSFSVLRAIQTQNRDDSARDDRGLQPVVWLRDQKRVAFGLQMDF